jgi:hypothetical protein
MGQVAGGIMDGRRRDLVDGGPSGGAGAREDDLADEARFFLRDDLCDEAAHRQIEQIDLVEAKGADEPHRVVGHPFDRVRRGAARSTHPAVPEGDPTSCGESVDDARIPVVQVPGQVDQEDQRHAVLGAELPIGELHPVNGHGAGRCVLVRRS